MSFGFSLVCRRSLSGPRQGDKQAKDRKHGELATQFALVAHLLERRVGGMVDGDRAMPAHDRTSCHLVLLRTTEVQRYSCFPVKRKRRKCLANANETGRQSRKTHVSRNAEARMGVEKGLDSRRRRRPIAKWLLGERFGKLSQSSKEPMAAVPFVDGGLYFGRKIGISRWKQEQSKD